MPLPQLTFLRFLAALLVVLYHYGYETFEIGLPFLDRLISHGAVAVSFFFFLSGVVIGVNYLDRPFRAIVFWQRRGARIAPLYILAFGLTLALQAWYFGDLPRGNAIIAQLLAVHAWFPEMCLAINYPAWSISVEVFFYLLVPLASLLLLQWGVKGWSLAILTLWIVNIGADMILRDDRHTFAQELSGAFVLYFPVLHVGTFAIGLVCAKLIRIMTGRGQGARWSMPLVLAGIGTLVVLFTTENPLKDVAHNGGAVPGFFLLILGLALDRGMLTRMLSMPPMVLLGDSSYAIYLLQFPVFMLFTNGQRAGSLSTAELTGYVAMLVVTSVIVFTRFERPAKRIVLDFFSDPEQTRDRS